MDKVEKDFWSSYPVEKLSPEQRKHFKAIMRKEVRPSFYSISE